MTMQSAQNGLDGAARAPAKLIALSGRDKGSVYPLPERGEVFLGRAETNQVALQDSEASRRHCRIIADGDGYRLQDMGSTNGSFVDGKKVTEVSLLSGAKIHVGETTLVFVLAEEAQRAAAPVAVTAEPREQEAAPRRPPEERAAPPPARKSRKRLVLAAAAVLLAGAAAAALIYTRTGAHPFVAGTRPIAVGSSPSGAEVFLDDRYVGMTPIQLELTAGEPHALRLAKRGCRPSRTLVDSATPRQLTVKLQPEPTATLLVSASKPDTEVYLDGRFVGKTGGAQPLRIPGVKLGQHELRLQRPNYLPYYKQIDVTRAAEIREHGKLESRQELSIRNLIAQEPNSARLYTDLGHHYMVHKQLNKAMAAYKKAWELVYAGTDSSGYSRRLAQEMQKLVQGSHGVFRYGTEEEMRVTLAKLEDVFIELLPQYPSAKTRLSSLVQHYSAKGHYDDAIRLYRKLLAVQPDDINAYYRLASFHMSQHDYEAEIAVLQQGADRMPDHWAIHFRLGQAYSRRAAEDTSEKDKRQAITHLEKALRLCKSSTQKRSIQYYLTKAQGIKVN